MKQSKTTNRWTLYKHTTPSGKVYIGITSQNVKHRWNNGKGYLSCTKSPFKSAIIKYDWDNIKHEILLTDLSEEDAKEFEKLYIQYYKNLHISLNITDGGDGCCGRIPWNKNIKVPYEKSNRRKGCKLTEEHKKKLSLSHKGIKQKDVMLLHVYDNFGNYLGSYSVRDIIDAFGGNHSNICRACKNKNGVYNGLQFRYPNEKDVNIGYYDKINGKKTFKITAYNIKTGQIIIFDSKYDLPRYLNTTPRNMFNCIKRYGHYNHWNYKQMSGDEL